MLSPLSERSRLHLHRAGYGVAFRSQEWSECLISRADERWLGHGALDDEAFNDALRQMLPSRLARELFQAQLASSPEEQASAEPAAATEDTPPIATENTPPRGGGRRRSCPGDSGAGGKPFRRADRSGRTDRSAAGRGDRGAASTPPRAPPRNSEIAGPAPRAAAAEPESKTLFSPRPSRPSRRCSAISTMSSRSSPRSPRSASAFIYSPGSAAPAPSEEALPDARPVVLAVQRIARRLSEIGKMLWPGSVRALQIATTPADTMEPYAADGPPSSWAEAAERAEARRAEHIFKATSAGYDEDGWIDANAGKVAPPNPRRAAHPGRRRSRRAARSHRRGVARRAGYRGDRAYRPDAALDPPERTGSPGLGPLDGAPPPPLSVSGHTRSQPQKTIDPTFRPPSGWAPVDTAPPDSAPKKDISAEVTAELAELDPDGSTLLPG